MYLFSKNIKKDIKNDKKTDKKKKVYICKCTFKLNDLNISFRS